jgi:hypothetical protein
MVLFFHSSATSVTLLHVPKLEDLRAKYIEIKGFNNVFFSCFYIIFLYDNSIFFSFILCKISNNLVFCFETHKV